MPGVGLGRLRLGGGTVAADPRELEHEVDDVGLLGSGRRLAAEGLGDGDQLVAVLALQSGAFEGGGVHAHRRTYLKVWWEE